MLQPIVELDRLVAISPEPHAVAIDGNVAYISSRATRRIDVIDARAWSKTAELEPPGMAWGMAFGCGNLFATCGETDDDHRRIRRYAGATGWGDGFIACPDDTGSHLGVYNERILLGQWYNKVLLLLDDEGGAARRFNTLHGVAGVAVTGDTAYLLTTDDEEDGEYWITRLDLREGGSQDVALVPFHARGLSWDGQRFWTNHREADRVVTFKLPA